MIPEFHLKSHFVHPFYKEKLGILLFLFVLANHMTSAQNNISIGFLGIEPLQECTGERLAAFQSLRQSRNSEANYIQIKNLKKQIQHHDVLWYHRPDSLPLSSSERSPKFLEPLKTYIQNGGTLILTLDALRLLPLLGLEADEPATKKVSIRDEGYGRKAGLHAYRDHPIFDSLFGGSYIFAPDKDMDTRQMGWFGNNLPSGKTIAVDWAYINLREDSKLLVEYTLGAGKVLVIGAYTWFNQENLNQRQLRLFFRNCIHYLVGPSKSPANFWNYELASVIKLPGFQDTALIFDAESWKENTHLMTLRRKYPQNQPFELAGESVLLMGKENGGIDEIWAHPFMALRDYEAGIIFEGNDSILWLNSQQPEIEVRPESYTRTYRFRRSYLKEIISCHPTEATSVVHYEFHSINAARIVIKMKTNLRFMWPYSEKVSGSLCYLWHPGLQALLVRNQKDEFAITVGANRSPIQQLAGRFDDFNKVIYPPDLDRMIRADSVFLGVPTEKMQVASLMLFNLQPNDQMDLVITASAKGQKDAIDSYRRAIPKPQWVQLSALRYTSGLFDKKTMLTSPDDTFNEGYRWAVVGTDRFFVNTPGIGRSMVAGYSTTDYGWDGGHAVNGRPGYAWYFGRDGVWSSYAALGYGDFEKVKTVLELFSKYQDISGKIFHELTTSGVAHYDAADATPLYISLAGKYLRYSGDTAFIRSEWNHIKKALEYCYSTDTDNDGLIENTLVGHGWEEGGALFGSHTTFYLASCWAEALHQAAYMASILGNTKDALQYTKEEGKVLQMLDTDFWNPERNFFYHGKNIDGTYHPEPAIMACVPLLFGQIRDSSHFTPVLETIAGNEFSSDWGTRILSENSAYYKPGSYHQGSVWPLFTGWAALAEFRYGRFQQGYSHLMNNLLTYKSWALGFVPEVLHGQEYKPFGVCPHQCWSETMVLQPALDGLLGYQPDASGNRIMLTPQFPAEWDSLAVTNLRMGNDYFSFNFLAFQDHVQWKFLKSGNNALSTQVVLSLPSYGGMKIHRVLVDGKEVEPEHWNGSTVIRFQLQNKVTIEIYRKAATVTIPEISIPTTNSFSNGYRLITEEMKAQNFIVRVNGKSGNDAILKIKSPALEIQPPMGCQLISRDKDIFTYRFMLPVADSKYVTIPLVFTLQ